MRVLQINKFLYGGAGAETVMFRTADLLRANGDEVSFFAMRDPRNVPCEESEYFPAGRYYGAEHGLLQRARSAASSIYSVEARRALRRLLRDRRPDVAHLHNVYHQLTLSVVDELAAQDIPTVMTLHDYKPVCPSYVLYTEGAPCHRCVTSHPGHAIAHRCIKGSRAASAVGAAEALLARARGSYGRIDAFISPSRHLAEVMVAGGHPAERIHVIPNFVADEQFRRPDAQSARPRAGAPMALFVGRLEEVKGVRVLLAAARRVAPGIEVVIVGRGPLEAEVREAESNGVVRYVGRRDWREIAQLMDRAHALVVPSLWEENCPMVVLEAGARGCPVLASDRGGLADLVSHDHDGLLFSAGDEGALADSLRTLVGDPALRGRLGEARYARTAAQNTSTAYLEALRGVYGSSIARGGNSNASPLRHAQAGAGG
jgi:glycosyltransferase involved in cell wall biosynthesis